MTLSAHLYRCRIDAILLKGAENLRSLSFDLLFLATNVWKNIVYDVERSNARITSAGKCLQSCRNCGLNSERSMKRRQGKDEHDRRTVGIGNDESTRWKTQTLSFQQLKMLVVHFWNQQRNIFVHPKRRRVANHRITSFRKATFSFASDVTG